MNMMKPFLELVAECIIALKEDAVETAVILPNKRSVILLKDMLKQKINQSFWLPEFYSLDSFFHEVSGFSKADSLQLALDLFDIHQKLTGKDHRSMEDFLSWAPIIVSDFNDVDLNLADSTQLFQHLSANKAIQEWNPDGRPLTPMQQNYLNFYRSLLDYYRLLRENLIFKRVGYPGLVYRELAENFSQYSTEWPWKQFLIAGINALSPAETSILAQLTKHAKVDFLWDVDAYYYESENSQAINPEPGRFIQSFIQKLNLPTPSPIENRLKTEDKTIDFVGIQGEIAQTKYVAQWLQEQHDQLNQGEDQLRKTAIVLADEQLLVPLLDALPAINADNNVRGSYNITMGYPLKNSSFEIVIQQWTGILQHMERTGGSVLTMHLQAFLRNPLIKIIFNDIQSGFAEGLCKTFISDNIFSLSPTELNDFLSKSSTEFSQLFRELLSAKTGLQFISQYQHVLQRVQGLENPNESNALVLHQLTAALEVSRSLAKILKQNQHEISLKAVEKILLQFIRKSQVHLVGEPLEGIQVMGLLETRNLDFERILFISCNEGFLPASDQMETFIPFDIRHQFKMPLPKDNQDVTAYHFYRLLQRAKHITYAYNTSTARLGSNDESRFLLQLENELAVANPQIKITRKQLNLNIDTSFHHQKIEVASTEVIRKVLKEKALKGFSPSALNTYIVCPLRFYYRYALGVWPDEVMEQSMESNTFGSLVHGALENIYKPLEGKVIEPDFLKKQMQSTYSYLENEYRKIYKGNGPIKGKNLLMMEVSKNMVNQTILNDCQLLEKEPRILIGIENKVHATISTRYGPVNLQGTIDRVDKAINNHQVRIIDYKTGRVLPKNLKITDLESMFLNPDNSKAFQLMQYALMFFETHPESLEMTAGNISLRNLSQGFLELKFEDNTALSSNLAPFRRLLTGLLETILSPNQIFKQTEDRDACTYCDYRQICNRI